ncbi:MAG: hypothetical protein N2652_10595 [Kiritimatiellae bacterium]|nr:hypothetical protein [Kiritimatiellia bacterium]
MNRVSNSGVVRGAAVASRTCGWVVLAWMAGASEPSAPQVGPWQRVDGARLEERRYADGDSFVLSHGGTSVMYRLYFADAPETDRKFPERVREQARRFGISAARIPELGASAAEFTAGWLREGPVTVWTREEPAGGREELGRRFALIVRAERWLHEELIAAGWARAYGRGVDLPDGTSEAVHWRRLDELEAEARRSGRGAWAAGGRRWQERGETGGKRRR